MMSILGKTNNLIIIMSRNILLILSIYFFQITLYAQESTTISDQSENLVEEIKDKYSIIGKVAYGNGAIVGDAEVTLLDTNEKLILTTRTSRKFLKRFGGGKFRFDEVLPDEYIINVDLGTRVGISKQIRLKDKDLNLGTIYNIVEFPKYEIADYVDSTLMYRRRIPTDPIEPDSINIRHIIVELDGRANTVIVDSILGDSIFYTDSINDLPLLETVTTPIVVDPDQQLEQISAEKGWQSLSLRG